MSVASPVSVFAGVSSVGFSGSRSPSAAASAALAVLLPLVPSGVRVSVGCARGVDTVVRGFVSGSRPPAWSGVSWSAAGALGSAGCWWLGVPVPAPSQLSLF